MNMLATLVLGFLTPPTGVEYAALIPGAIVSILALGVILLFGDAGRDQELRAPTALSGRAVAKQKPAQIGRQPQALIESQFALEVGDVLPDPAGTGAQGRLAPFGFLLRAPGALDCRLASGGGLRIGRAAS